MDLPDFETIFKAVAKSMKLRQENNSYLTPKF